MRFFQDRPPVMVDGEVVKEHFLRGLFYAILIFNGLSECFDFIAPINVNIPILRDNLGRATRAWACAPAGICGTCITFELAATMLSCSSKVIQFKNAFG